MLTIDYVQGTCICLNIDFIIHPWDPTMVIWYLIWLCDMDVLCCIFGLVYFSGVVLHVYFVIIAYYLCRNTNFERNIVFCLTLFNHLDNLSEPGNVILISHRHCRQWSDSSLVPCAVGTQVYYLLNLRKL